MRNARDPAARQAALQDIADHLIEALEHARAHRVSPDIISNALAALDAVRAEQAGGDGPSITEQKAASAFKAGLIKRVGGMLDVHQASVVTGETAEAINRLVAARLLLAVDDAGERRFPAFQFSPSMRERLSRVLQAAPSTSGWAVLQFLYGVPEGLAGRRPIELLAGEDSDVATVERFARALED